VAAELSKLSSDRDEISALLAASTGEVAALNNKLAESAGESGYLSGKVAALSAEIGELRSKLAGASTDRWVCLIYGVVLLSFCTECL
jgi:predicted  nucleic acid-binding Zn-ribbon protein